jgi:hypothetical protein
MIVRGKKVKKPKFEIGNLVIVNELKYTFGSIGHAQYRDAEGATTGWFYKVQSVNGGYQSWPESYLRKLTKKEYQKKLAEFKAWQISEKQRISDLIKRRK